MKTILIALLTALFEGFGLLLCAVRTPGVFDTQALTLLAVMAPLCMATALVLPRLLPIDPLLMALTNFLCGVGVVILYTVSPERGAKQAAYYVLGIAAMIVVSLIVFHKRRFKGLAMLSMVLGIGALILPLAFGEWSGGAKNWVQLPFLVVIAVAYLGEDLPKMILCLTHFFSGRWLKPVTPEGISGLKAYQNGEK